MTFTVITWHFELSECESRLDRSGIEHVEHFVTRMMLTDDLLLRYYRIDRPWTLRPSDDQRAGCVVRRRHDDSAEGSVGSVEASYSGPRLPM